MGVVGDQHYQDQVMELAEGITTQTALSYEQNLHESVFYGRA